MANDEPVALPSMPTPDPPAPIEALHSPYHARTIYRDMEILRQSRQDNPYLKMFASSHSQLNTSSSMSCSSGGGHDDSTDSNGSISLDLHSRLIRSPPPIMWNRKSEPSFSKLDLDSSCVFQFPPTGGTGGGGGDRGDKSCGKVEGKLGLSPGRTRQSYRQQ